MNLASINRALLWKDLRQLSPLIAMLVVVVVFLWLLRMLIGSNDSGIPSVWIPLAMPSLLAAGAGAILVGNEKETRTLRWVVSLPIPFQSVFWSKLIAGAIGLVAMWIVALILLAVMGQTFTLNQLLRMDGSALKFNVSFWIVHTFFLLCAGIYTAWRIENAFGSLIAMLPVAAIPFVMSNVGSKWIYSRSNRYMSPEEVVGITMWFTIPAIVIVVWLGYRAAARFFDASPAPRTNAPSQRGDDSSAGSVADLDAWRPPPAAMPAREPFRFSFSSLVWQSVHHNAWTFAGLASAVFVGVISLASIPTQSGIQWAGGVVGFTSMLSFLCVSWLGVFAFAGDGSSPRLKFLADRGISPTLVWLTRHAAATGVIAAALLAYHATLRWVTLDGYLRAAPAISLTALMLGAVLVYGVSQWTSQVIRVLGGTAFLAPLLSGMSIAWLMLAIGWMGVSPWVVLVCIAIPLAATWSSMRWHMDGHRGVAFSAIHAGVLVLMLALPIANLVWDVSRFPSMSGSRKAVVMQAASELDWPPKAPRSILSTLLEPPSSNDFQSDGKRSGQEMADLLNSMDGLPVDFLTLDSNANQPLRAEYYTLQSAKGTAEFHRLRAIAGEEDWTKFSAWSDFLVEIARRSRMSYRIEDQCGADAIEIYLTQTYARPEMSEVLDEDFAQRAIRFVGDPTLRNDARRRAVLASYRFFIEDRYEVNDEGKRIYRDKNLGGYDLNDWFAYVPPYQVAWVQPRGASAVVDELLRMIDAGQSGQPTLAMRQRLHDLMFGPDTFFETGPYADRLRVSSSPRDLALNHFTTYFPGSQWYADWETDAAQMSAKLTNQPESEVAP